MPLSPVAKNNEINKRDHQSRNVKAVIIQNATSG